MLKGEIAHVGQFFSCQIVFKGCLLKRMSSESWTKFNKIIMPINIAANFGEDWINIVEVSDKANLARFL